MPERREPSAAGNGDTSARAAYEPLSVSRLNSLVRDRLQSAPELINIYVIGELNNVTHHSSGHLYFSLKDETSLLNCTFFSQANRRYSGPRLRDGMQVIVRGSISLYLPRGTYQLNVTAVQIAGEGEIRQRIEELKRRLHEEGLFAPERKRPLPFLPRTIGVATAPTGAAVRDIIRVAHDRCPNLQILVAPCRVQGESAAASIVAAITELNRPQWGVDVIIAGRGGGSFEDLVAFNEELVVRAFAESRLPIVSAVGHEVDVSLSDFAADATAPTPTAAAQLVVPDYTALTEMVGNYQERLVVASKLRMRRERERLERIAASRIFQRPTALLEPLAQRLDYGLRELERQLPLVTHLRWHLLERFESLPLFYRTRLAHHSQRYGLAAERLDNFSPLSTLGRGYAVTRRLNGALLRRAEGVEIGEELEILLAEGSLTVEVRELSSKSDPRRVGGHGSS